MNMTFISILPGHPKSSGELSFSVSKAQAKQASKQASKQPLFIKNKGLLHPGKSRIRFQFFPHEFRFAAGCIILSSLSRSHDRFSRFLF